MSKNACNRTTFKVYQGQWQGTWRSPLGIIERIILIRKYRNLSRAEVGSWFNMSDRAWGKVERGETRSLNFNNLQLFLERTQIDARWLFSQIDVPIEEADLRLRGPERSLTQQMIDEIQELRKRTRPLKELDPLAERVVNDTSLRRIVELLIRRRSSFERIQGYLEGLEEGSRETGEDLPVKKEKAE